MAQARLFHTISDHRHQAFEVHTFLLVPAFSTVVNQELVRYVQERDSLTFERDVILNHIEELSS